MRGDNIIIIAKYKYLLLAMCNCGMMTDFIAKKFYKKCKEDINYLIRNKYIKDAGNYMIFKETIKIYSLTSKGKRILKAYGKSIYKSDLTQVEHDYLLLNIYSSLDFQKQESWKNETELKVKFKTETTTDAIYNDGKNIIGVEVITPNYNKKKIDEKKVFINNNSYKSIIVSTVKAMSILK